MINTTEEHYKPIVYLYYWILIEQPGSNNISFYYFKNVYPLSHKYD